MFLPAGCATCAAMAALSATIRSNSDTLRSRFQLAVERDEWETISIIKGALNGLLTRTLLA
jgi:hypothetical protein